MEKIQGLKRAAETDPMTGLLNKASSQFEIGEACKHTPGMLMMIDLDSFKLVNDLYGHAMGDKVLIRFAEIIKSAIRSADIAGRMASAKEFMGEDMNIPLGASIGAVAVPDEGIDFATLYAKADKALYQVKQNGKHGYAIYSEHEDSEETEDKKESGIAREVAILKERNKEKGAMNLPNEQFRLIYRFLASAELNYHRENKLALFTVEEPGNETDEEPAQMLIDLMCNSLRSSDVVTKRSRNTVSVILLEASPVDTNIIIERLVNKWNELDTGMKITYEVEQIG